MTSSLVPLAYVLVVFALRETYLCGTPGWPALSPDRMVSRFGCSPSEGPDPRPGSLLKRFAMIRCPKNFPWA